MYIWSSAIPSGQDLEKEGPLGAYSATAQTGIETASGRGPATPWHSEHVGEMQRNKAGHMATFSPGVWLLDEHVLSISYPGFFFYPPAFPALFPE